MKRKLNEDDVPQEVASSKVATQQKATSAADFTFLPLDPRLIQAVKREKFSTPTSVQLKSIPLSLEGKDVLVRAKTGSGKTLAYLLPAIHGILHRKISSTGTKRTSVLILVPTKELANQVTAAIKTFTSFCAQDVRAENICRKEDDAVTKARLAENPDLVIATPSRASHWINEENLDMTGIVHLVIDEADVMLSYEYEEDLETIASSLPNSAQRTFTSATLREEVDTLTQLFFKDKAQPTVVDLSAEEAEEEPTLAQYTMKTAEQDKFLLIYTIFKLQLIKGKVIIFVADVDRCYRVKLFLEQFGIRSCVLNSELPVNSRLHVVEEFNRGVYDIIIAADENEVVGDESSRKKRKGAKPNHETAADDAPVEVPEEADASKPPPSSINGTSRGKKSASHRNPRSDREFGVSRGIDFRNVSCVLNFDLPTSAKSYTHRIGRTARAGRTGMALSFYIPGEEYRKHKPTSIEQSQHDETVLAQIIARQAERGATLQEYTFDMTKVEGFRYRLADALRAVTRIAVREARTRELRQELIKSEKLRRHFEENPDDLRHLRHDTVSHAVRQQPHLKHVPDYLLPAGGSKAVVASEVGFVSARKNPENHLRRARAFNRARGKGRIAKTKGLDPLKSLNARGREKK